MDKVRLSTMSTVKKTNQFLLKQYHELNNPASYGGVSRFAKNQGISLKRAKTILENDLGYTLHKPRRSKFTVLPVKVFTMDEQWTADLIEVIKSDFLRVSRIGRHSRKINFSFISPKHTFR